MEASQNSVGLGKGFYGQSELHVTQHDTFLSNFQIAMK